LESFETAIRLDPESFLPGMEREIRSLSLKNMIRFWKFAEMLLNLS
jgi:hypothetical protein